MRVGHSGFPLSPASEWPATFHDALQFLEDWGQLCFRLCRAFAREIRQTHGADPGQKFTINWWKRIGERTTALCPQFHLRFPEPSHRILDGPPSLVFGQLLKSG